MVSLLCFYSCIINNSKINFSEQIKGDWFSANEEYYGKNGQLIFSFEDSLCSYEYPWGSFSSYIVIKDSLFIKEQLIIQYGDTTGGKEIMSFKIKYLTESILILTPDSISTSLLGFGYWNTTKEFKLVKIRKKNNFKFKKIGFYSGSCLGNCPNMYLELDSLGRLIFDELEWTPHYGLYSANLSSPLLAMVNNKINLMNFDFLKTKYVNNDNSVCEGPQRIVFINIDNCIYDTYEHCGSEPIELSIIFHVLMELHNQTVMYKDSTITKEFEFRPNLVKYIPPPPPPSQLNKKNGH